MIRPFWRVRAFCWTERAIGRVFNAVQTLNQGFWLGVLDREVLHVVSEHGYLSWKRLYRDRDYNLSGLWAWEMSAIDRFFPVGGSILVCAAGGGREIVAVAKKGFKVDAFDCSEDFVESCRALLQSESVTARLFVSAPDKVPEGLNVYDALIVGWGAYMHIAGRETRVELLKVLRRHVRADGPVLISFLTRKGDSQKARWVLSIASAIRRLRGSREKVEMGDALYSAFNHLFTRNEIRDELKEAGFKLEYYAEQPYGHAVGVAAEAADKNAMHDEIVP